MISRGAVVNSIPGSSVPAGRMYLELYKVLRMCHLLCLESSRVCRYGESVEMLCVFQLAGSLEKVNSLMVLTFLFSPAGKNKIFSYSPWVKTK